MSIARVIEISSRSNKSFENAIEEGVAKVAKTHEIKSAWVKEQKVRIQNGTINAYQVILKVTFVIDDGAPV